MSRVAFDVVRKILGSSMSRMRSGLLLLHCGGRALITCIILPTHGYRRRVVKDRTGPRNMPRQSARLREPLLDIKDNIVTGNREWTERLRRRTPKPP